MSEGSFWIVSMNLKTIKISSWKIKRSFLKRRVQKNIPDITKNELEYLYQLSGFDAKSNPMNKHYVRCMHDD